MGPSCASPLPTATPGTPRTVEIERASGKVLLLVTAKTKVEATVGKERRPCTLADLRPGDRIEAVCSPEFAASEPPQAAVRRLLVLP
jgi:hypothetical protein